MRTWRLFVPELLTFAAGVGGVAVAYAAGVPAAAAVATLGVVVASVALGAVLGGRRAGRHRDRLFSLNPTPSCRCDLAGRVIAANAAWGRALGCPAEDLVGRTQADLVHADDRAGVQAALDRLQAGEAVAGGAFRYRRFDGGLVWLDWSAVADAGSVLILGHDITAQRAAEQALRRSEQRFRDVAEAASEFVWEASADGRIMFVSRRLRAILGRAPDDVLGLPLIDLLAAEGRAVLEASLRRGAPFVVEVPAVRGEGVAWLRLSGQPVLPDDGVVDLMSPEPRHEGYRGAAQDITESRQSRQALLDSEARYRGIVNTIVDAIVTIDARGIIRSVNPAAERLFGYAAREMIDANVAMLMPGPDRRHHDRHIQTYIRTGVAQMIGAGREVEARRKDGSVFPMELGLSEVFLGSQRFFIAACRDMSERKRVERLKDEFVATVSHELRTPLTAMRGALGLVVGGTAGPLPEKASGLLSVALANCDRLGDLVETILDIGHIGSGLASGHLERVDLRAVVGRSLDAHAQALAAAGARAVVGPDDGPPVVVRGEVDRLVQMVGNLLSNAIKVSPRGGLIEVRVAVEDGQAVLSVSDQGPGIPDGFRHLVFERFTQADGSTTRGLGGSGLGLAVVRAISVGHGGGVTFSTTTEPPTGSTFRVSLPLFAAVSESEMSEEA